MGSASHLMISVIIANCTFATGHLKMMWVASSSPYILQCSSPFHIFFFSWSADLILLFNSFFGIISYPLVLVPAHYTPRTTLLASLTSVMKVRRGGCSKKSLIGTHLTTLRCLLKLDYNTTKWDIFSYQFLKSQTIRN